MLPRAAYVDPDVLAWERSHFFDGELGVRRPAGRRRRAAVTQQAMRIGTTGVLLVARRRRRAARLRQHLPPPRPRAAGLRRHDEPRRRSSARTTPGATSSTGRCAWRPASATSPNFDPRRARPACRWRTTSGAVGSSSTSTGTRRSVRRPPGRVRATRGRWECERLVVGGDATTTSSQANWKIAHRELPRVLPLPADPPGAVPGVAAATRGDNFDDVPGRVGRRHDGPGRRRRRR